MVTTIKNDLDTTSTILLRAALVLALIEVIGSGQTRVGQEIEAAEGVPQAEEDELVKGKEQDKLRMVDKSFYQEILPYIQQEWGFMADDSCVPVQVALQLMDPSSLGRAHQALPRIQQFIAHVPRNSNQHTVLTDSSATTQRIASTSKVEFIVHEAGARGSSNVVSGLWRNVASFVTDQLQLVPEKLEARISEKRFLTAVEVLQDALETIRKPEIENIGALSDLRVYFSNQKASLTDILIEELHNHLYLKSPYCQDRWKPYAHDQGTASIADGKKGLSNLGVKPIHQFLETLDASIPMIEDASRNPEADSNYYIHLLIESLNKMGHLHTAIESIEQRLPVELRRVVDKTNKEVDQRHPSSMRGSSRRESGKIDLGLGENNVRAIIVFDLLWTLYSKFEAIAEGHRVLHDVVVGIVKREGIQDADSLTGGFSELWKLYQSEMRSLLHDYLATDGNVSYRSGQAPSGGNVFRIQRDRSKRMFKLQDMDAKSPELASEQEDLELILKASVPGLVSDSRRPMGISVIDNNQHHDGSATGHRLLVEPSVFNMGLLLPPSLSFLQRLKDIVPSGPDIVINTLTSFLDDFFVNVFHPQLDETLVDLGVQTYAEVDAFQEDPQWPTIARKPIFKGTSTFFNLIAVFCKMLDTIPHDQAFSQLIITQMVTYHDKCCEWYKGTSSYDPLQPFQRSDGYLEAIVSGVQSKETGGSHLKTAAAFAQSGELRDIARSLWDGTDGGKSLLEKKWLASKVRQLRYITDIQVDSSQRDGSKPRQVRRWTLIDPSRPRDESSPVYLPMTQKSVIAFDAVIESYQQLALAVLLTLHFEIRCHIILHIEDAIKGGFLLQQPANEPDSSVLTLNTDLVGFDEEITNNLRDEEHRFLITGLSHLLDTYLLTNASHMKPMNTFGSQKLHLNILVLQQNLRNIEPNALLPLSARYFNLFTKGPPEIVKRAKEGDKDGEPYFSYDQLKVLVELCYSEALGSERREVAMGAKRGLGEHLLLLSEQLWQT
ncbi:hypothetical protein FGG08_004801 [Glutinoglossum americanum]|uniref:Exocyst complex component Sec8 n=1 Tax=Glutinoglossum americanum TaxID=1670608 RepID=A0A9P8IAM6_9PEZI|nr:hypothetical protein FGG08_004801 [Glutinoglossum americanum]